MAQTTILAAAQTEANSDDVVVASGQTVNVGMFVASGDLPAGITMNVVMVTPGAEVKIYEISRARPSCLLAGPGTFRVKRANARGVNVGVYKDA